MNTFLEFQSGIVRNFNLNIDDDFLSNLLKCVFSVQSHSWLTSIAANINDLETRDHIFTNIDCAGV